MYRMTIWRRVFMEEKINRSFFARNREISRILIDAVRDGLLIPYHSDSLERRMTKEEFEERLVIKTGDDEDSWGSSTGGDGWDEPSSDEAEGGDPWAQDAGDDVWGSSARDVWVVGSNWIENKGVFPKILRFDGTSWTYMEVESLGEYTYLNAVWGTAPNDVWIAGFFTTADREEHTIVFHFDGKALARVDDAQVAYPGTIWGAGPEYILIGGMEKVARWNGSNVRTWSSCPTAHFQLLHDPDFRVGTRQWPCLFGWRAPRSLRTNVARRSRFQQDSGSKPVLWRSGR